MTYITEPYFRFQWKTRNLHANKSLTEKVVNAVQLQAILHFKKFEIGENTSTVVKDYQKKRSSIGHNYITSD